MSLGGVLGHDRIQRILAKALAEGRFPPALLLSGPEGVGKRTLALAAAAALLCERGGGAACGACSTCTRIARSQQTLPALRKAADERPDEPERRNFLLHPDLVLVEPRRTATRLDIRIEQVRDVVRQLEGRPFEARARRRHRAAIAIAIIVAVVAAAASGIVAAPIAFLAGAVAMVATGCVAIGQAYREIDVRIYVMIAGVIPLGLAMEKTGTAALFASGNVQDAISVDIKRNLDLRHSAWSGRNTGQVELAERTIVSSQRTLALQHVDFNGSLTIRRGGESLRLAGGDSRVARNHRRGDASQGFD